MKIENANIPAVNFTEQASNFATPASGKWRVYFKADGMYIIDDAGVVKGPLLDASSLPPTESGPFQLLNYSEWFDDFLYHASHATYASSFTSPAGLWKLLANGSNQFSNLTSEANHPGIFRTSLTGGGSAYTIQALTNDQNNASYNSWIVASGSTLKFETLVRFSAVPTDAENYYIYFGMTDVNNATDAIRIYMERSGGVNQWRAQTVNNSAGTSTNSTAVAINANQWYRLRFEATTTDVKFYVNSTLIATHTTNIPDSRLTIYNVGICVAGVASRYVDMDYIGVRVDFPNGRQ